MLKFLFGKSSRSKDEATSPPRPNVKAAARPEPAAPVVEVVPLATRLAELAARPDDDPAVLETALANGATGKEVHTRPTPPAVSEAYLHYPVYRRNDLTLVYSVKPEYPEAAKQARIEGVVTVGAIVGKDGKVTRVQAVNGNPLLVPAAITAVKQWLYRPVMVNGEPVEVRTTIEVTFSLHTG